MKDKKVWLITGAGRGLGLDIAKAALAAGHNVVATGRSIEKVEKAIGARENLLVAKLDITKQVDADAAVVSAIQKFGRIDVLVNNAANFVAGFFEELSQEEMENQLNTGLFGPMKVTRAVLPIMRKQRSGYIISISSLGGLTSFGFCSAYSAAKFGLEGWMQALKDEVEPFGIRATVVNPGFFRTELLTEDSTSYAKPAIEDYNERRTQQMQMWRAANGQQSGDPAKLAQVLIKIADMEEIPYRFVAGADAVESAEQVAATLQQQIKAHQDLSLSLAYE